MNSEALEESNLTNSTSSAQATGFERRAVIDLSAIRNNVKQISDVVAPAAVMAVVKADAYGHGAIQVAKAALEGGARWIGCAHVTEALALREAGIDAPMLAWLHTEDTPFEAAIDAGLDLGVSGWELNASPRQLVPCKLRPASISRSIPDWDATAPPWRLCRTC